MKYFLIGILLVIALQISYQSTNATTVSPTTKTFLIQFNAETTVADRDAILRELDAQLLDWIEPIHVAKVAIAQETDTVRSSNIHQSVLASPHIKFYEEDAIVSGMYTPNDPDLQDIQRGYGHQIINLPAAWDFTRGDEEILIAILDSGINAGHTELAKNIVDGYDFINADSDPADDQGHGSHVSGIVAAEIDNHIGSTGVCPKCRIMPIKVLNQSNTGTWSAIIDGIIYATDNNARIINISLGGERASKAVEAAVEYAHSKSVLVVAAAGNSRSQIDFYPAAYPHVLAVAATDHQDQQWELSNSGSYVDVSAPGHLIYSTSKSTGNGESGYAFMSGTSMAAPYVSGLAGLLLSQDPTRTPEEVTKLIIDSADDLGPPGWDPAYGHGRINAARALSLGQLSLFEVKSSIYLPIINAE